MDHLAERAYFNLRLETKKLVSAIISTCTTQKESLPILLGKLREKRLPKAVAIQNLRMLFNGYERHLVSEIISMPGQIRIAYDIGAHVGYMTLALAQRVGSTGKVYAFEPCPDNRVFIEELILHNNLMKIVNIMDLALADTNGHQNLILGETSFMHSLDGVAGRLERAGKMTINVKTSTLDTFVFDHSHSSPDLLKIDVEGAEDLVIQGGLRTLNSYAPKLLIEIHGPTKAGNVWNLIKDFSYSWTHLTSNGKEAISSLEKLLSFFSKDSWTHHFFLKK